MTIIVNSLYLINIFNSLFLFVICINSESTILCPIKECKCDLTQSFLSCDQNLQTISNTNLELFQNLVFNNISRLNGYSFENTHFAPRLNSLVISEVKLIQSNTWSWSLNSPDIRINNLHLSFSSDIIIEPNSFDYLICDTLVLTCLRCQNNQAISVNNFGENTHINHLVLDFQTVVNASNSQTISLFRNNIDRFNKMSDYNQNVQYDEYWSAWYIEANIEDIFVKNVKGIFALDYKFLPNFKNLKKIQIVNTDLNTISETFSFLHSKNLKSLIIQESNIEYIKSNIFEALTNLELLDLSYNPIKRFELQTFNGLTNLRSLNLNGLKGNGGFKNEDLCMLSYLPCKIDLQLDLEFFGSEENCALAYLSEIKFKRLISSRQISPCNNLTDELAVCFKLSKRNMNESCVGSYSNDLILADVQFVRKENKTLTTTGEPFKTTGGLIMTPILTKFFNHKNKFDHIHHQNDSLMKNNVAENNKIEASTRSTNQVPNENYESQTPNFVSILASTFVPKIEKTLTKTLTKQVSSATQVFSELTTEKNSADNFNFITTGGPMKPRKEDNLAMESSSTHFISESSTMKTSLNLVETTEKTSTDKITTSPIKTFTTKTELEYTSKKKSLEMLNRKDANIHNHAHTTNNNELLYVIIIALVIFCMIQFLIGVFIFYLFFANKWNSSASVGSNQFLSKNTEIGVGDSDEPLDSTPVAANQSILQTILLNAQQQQQQSSSSTINMAMPGVRTGEGPSSSNIDTIYLEKNKTNSNAKNYKNKTIKNLYRPPIQFLRDTQSTLSLKWKSFIS